jgi:glyoxylase-like metal-dependent hydrolase (beta-lactamase superfamily II)
LQQDIWLYVLETGLIECADYAIFSPKAGPAVRQDMSVRSYLVVHPHGTLLWDTGISDAIGELRDGQQITESILFRVPKTLSSQLADINRSAADIDYLGLSHLHIDHVGNVGLFPRAKVIMQQAEYEAAYGPNAEQLTYIPETYAALAKDRIRNVVGDHDVFGDGSVVMKSLPGHTPGHQGLLVTLRRTGPILLAGDIAYSMQDYAEAVPRDSNFNLQQTRQSIEAAKRMEREQGATVWLHHDLEAQQQIYLAPRYYD